MFLFIDSTSTRGMSCHFIVKHDPITVLSTYIIEIMSVVTAVNCRLTTVLLVILRRHGVCEYRAYRICQA